MREVEEEEEEREKERERRGSVDMAEEESGDVGGEMVLGVGVGYQGWQGE